VNQEKLTEDVSKLYSALPKEIQEKAVQHYGSLSQDIKDKLNSLLNGLPERIIGSQNQEPQVEVKIEVVPEPEVKKEEPEPNVPVIEEIQVEKKEVEVEKEKEYPEEVKKKAQCLKEIFEDADLKNLLEFVAQAPDIALEELVENYLSL